MSEFVKLFAVLTLIAGSIASGIAWNEAPPTDMIWACRLGGAAAAVFALVLFLYIHFRKDLAADHLHHTVGEYFNRSGFTFAVAGFQAEHGRTVLHVYFQNQFARRSVAKIVLRPPRGWFSARNEMPSISLEIPCEPGAFGVARLPVSIPVGVQRSRQEFEVGVSVSYPDGKGRRIRFRDGIVVRSNAKFRNSFYSLLQIAGLFAGKLVWSSHAKVALALPSNVASNLSSDPPIEVRTIESYDERAIV